MYVSKDSMWRVGGHTRTLRARLLHDVTAPRRAPSRDPERACTNHSCVRAHTHRETTSSFHVNHRWHCRATPADLPNASTARWRRAVESVRPSTGAAYYIYIYIHTHESYILYDNDYWLPIQQFTLFASSSNSISLGFHRMAKFRIMQF